MTPNSIRDDGDHPHSDDTISHTSIGKRSRDQMERPHKIPNSIKSCNECRQQKLGCNVEKDPFKPCCRCTRLGIECKLDSDFKRVAKRHKHAEMQKEIEELKELVAKQAALLAVANSPDNFGKENNASSSTDSKPKDQRIDDILVTGEQLSFLYFSRYHHICPILDPTQTCDQTFAQDPVLGWGIVLVSARRYPQDPTLVLNLSKAYMKSLWNSISDMPQRASSIKALALLCTWPVPLIRGFTKSRNDKASATMGLSELDPTWMLSGIMMQISLQTGMHRPRHAQDFLKQTRDVSEAELSDRKLTWALCNIVSQSVSTANGQPTITIYDWGLGDGLEQDSEILPPGIKQRLKIEKFCQKVSKTLYGNSSEVTGVLSNIDEQISMTNMLEHQYQQLESESVTFSSLNKLYLLAARLHLHTFAFYVPEFSPNHLAALSSAYNSATRFIQALLDYDLHSEAILPYCSYYILKNLICASCVLLKILNSTYAMQFDSTQGRSLFNAAILALRSTSLATNDFSDRIAEALARMWRSAGSGDLNRRREDFSPIDIKIQSRMSISHVHDCFLLSDTNCNGPMNNSDTSYNNMNGDVMQQDQGATATYFQPGSLEEAMNFPPMIADFDLLNSLDWNFDENLLATWT
ncbi:putative zn 2cys6 transcriptional activator protein [Botrytis fragariae]|uniref:Putative zn 2cys6 transcriptional activator protein n=1 Tax=Botrytis fragariae TaxID=1964551 RepID=A0A8H6EGM7_9HELO|nr:putative zn 2cys6 transcriptional activator protein [Botrytis fragariae]KAF5871185.1 putative zn 2cys6 transcriptional activator protein [Botrytis fragariae]